MGERDIPLSNCDNITFLIHSYSKYNGQTSCIFLAMLYANIGGTALPITL